MSCVLLEGETIRRNEWEHEKCERRGVEDCGGNLRQSKKERERGNEGFGYKEGEGSRMFKKRKGGARGAVHSSRSLARALKR